MRTSARPSAICKMATEGFRSKRRGPAAPGLIDQPFAFALDQRAVGVAEHEDVGRIARQQPGRRRAAQFVPVADVDREAACLDGDFLRQQPIERIHVSVDGLHRCDGFQRVDHVASADIPSVQNL